MKQLKRFGALSLVLVTLALASCEKEYDSPPLNVIPEGKMLTIDSLRNMYQGLELRIDDEDLAIAGVITMDESSGNIYKTVYLQDATNAIEMRLTSSSDGDLLVGDSIRVNIYGTTISEYNGMMQLDSVDFSTMIVKIATNVEVAPMAVNIEDVNSSIQAKLVKLENVQFKLDEIGQTWADAVAQYSENRMLENCAQDREIIVRTSGYADFAGEVIPSMNGSLVCIVSEYQGDMQLLIRSLPEVQMEDTRCGPAPPLLKKDFEDENLNSGGWTTQLVTGTIDWEASNYNNENFALMSNYDGINFAAETWLISPAVDLSAATNPELSFRTACNYSGPSLVVSVSTDYDGTSAPSTATWTNFSPSLSSGSWNWVSSGALDLGSYKQAGVYIAFKYTGSSSDGRTWEVDDIMIEDN